MSEDYRSMWETLGLDLAVRMNRLAGHYAKPSPASQVMEMITHIPRAMEEVLGDRIKRT